MVACAWRDSLAVSMFTLLWCLPEKFVHLIFHWQDLFGTYFGISFSPMIPQSRCWSIVCRNSPLVAVWLKWLSHIDFWMQLLQCPVVETRDIKKMRLSHRIVTSGDTPKGCFPENDPSKKLRWQWKVHHFLLKRVFCLNYHVSFQECNIIRYIY